MKKNTCAILTSLILLISCTPDVTRPQPDPQPDGKLTHTIKRDTTGRVMNVTHFNDWKLPVTDSAFNAGNVLQAAFKWEYNAKGKLIRWSSKDISFFGDSNIVRLEEYTYANDTVLREKKRHFRGELIDVLRQYYNNAGEHVLDSFISSTNQLFWSKKKEYDNQGRVSRETVTNGRGDTLSLVTYVYPGNKIEKRAVSYSYNPFSKSNHLTVTDFTATGRILSELSYNNAGVNYLRTIYTYDMSGHLTSKHFTNSSSPSLITEERYINGSNGKPVTMQYYFQNQLSSITTFYYN